VQRVTFGVEDRQAYEDDRMHDMCAECGEEFEFKVDETARSQSQDDPGDASVATSGMRDGVSAASVISA
jgi:hypothetical protein